MRTFTIITPGKFKYLETEEPHPSSGEVRLKVKRLGLCGSDLASWRGKNPLISYPRVIGHEISGIIDEVGTDVPSQVSVGRKATLFPYTSCGQCSSCLAGRTNACKNNQTLGVQRDGASCEYILSPWEKLVFADDLSLNELVMVEPLSVGFHAVNRGRITENDFVGVFGSGMIGLGAIIGAAIRTDKVIAIDIAEEKLHLAKEVGAKYVINSAQMDLSEKLNEITNGHGPNVMIEAVGLPETFRNAVDEVAFAGRVVYIGYARDPVEYESRFFVMKELDVMGSRNAVTEDFSAVIDAMRNKTFDVNRLITRRISFNEIGTALDLWSADPLSITKLVVDMDS